MSQTEFSRIFPLDQIGSQPRAIHIAAEPDERAALAARFSLEAVHCLEADARIETSDDAILCQGRFSADVVQNCVATGVSLPVTLSNSFAIRFVRAVDADAGGGDIDIALDEFDIVEHDGRGIDIGEAVAQSLVLALDPFPRSAAAAETLRAAGVIGDDEVVTGAFADLKSLLRKAD